MPRGSADQSGSRVRIASASSRKVRAGEGMPPGEHLVQQAAERPHVGAPVHRLAEELLGAHVLRRADDGAGAGDAQLVRVDERALVRRVPRDAEVEQLDAPAGDDLHVGRLEVAMDDLGLVRRLERAGDLRGDGERFGERDRPSLQPLLERLARHELEHEEPLPLDLLDAIDRARCWDG